MTAMGMGDGHGVGLGLLLQLEHRARRAGVAELPFVMVNETAQLVPYQQAALWQCSDEVADSGRLAAASGVAVPEANAPYARWLTAILAHAAGKGPWDEPRPLGPADLPAALAGDWGEWLPPHALWCPLARAGGLPLGGLLLARGEAWSDGERQVLGLLAEHYAQCWILAHLPKTRVPWLETVRRRRKALAGAGVAIVLVALLPVRESSLVPAEVVPIDPLQVRAPFEGGVDAITVKPNAPVKGGQVLAALETAQLRTRLAVAVKARQIAEAEFGQAAQEAMNDEKAKGHLAVLRAKIDQQAAEVAFVENQLGRAQLAAPGDGIAIFDSPADWIGRPVSVGERIMLVADPRRIELELEVPVAEAVTFAQGADVTFFSNVSPEHPVDARVSFASYASAVTAEGITAYRFRAGLADPAAAADADLRIGLKGTPSCTGRAGRWCCGCCAGRWPCCGNG